MVKLDFTKVFTEEVMKGYKATGQETPDEIAAEILNAIVSMPGPDGRAPYLGLADQRLLFKILDKIEAKEELSDEQFQFFYDKINNGFAPTNRSFVQIADYLDLVKLKIAEAKK